MSERDTILTSSRPNTVSSLGEDLRLLGLQPGDTVLVHSSLSRMGWVCGGAQAVLQALHSAVSDESALGTLVMPAHSGDWSDPAEWSNPPVPEAWIPTIREEMPAFDPDTTPTRGMGVIAELFRTLPGTRRSNHPQVSFAANGPLAESLLRDHPLTPMMGLYSPLGHMYRKGTKVLLLGVGYESCTSFHLAEAMLQAMPVVRMGAAVKDNGLRRWAWFEDFNYDADDFPALGAAFETQHAVCHGQVGRAACRLFDMKTCVDFALEWMHANRRE